MVKYPDQPPIPGGLVLKNILVIAAVLFCIPLVIILTYEKSTLDHEILLKSPPEKVFRYLTVPEHMKLWIGGFRDLKSVNEVRGKGARYLLVLELEGTTYRIEETVTHWDPGKAVGLRMAIPDGFTSDLEYRLHPVDGGTRLSFHQETTYENALGKLFSAMINESARVKLEADLNRLNHLLVSKGS